MPVIYANSLDQRYLSRPVAYSDSQRKHVTRDISERDEVIYKLKQRAAHLNPSQKITLIGATISLESGSTLEDAQQPGKQLLQQMSEIAPFRKLLATLHIPEYSLFEVTAEGEINAKYSGKTLGFANVLKRATELSDDLQLLVEMAPLSGGVISLADEVELVQWLAFHRYKIPHSAGEALRLVNFMEAKPLAAPELGNYWEMINAAEARSATLSVTERNEFRKLIVSEIKDQSLLEHLSDSIFGGRTAPFTRSEAEHAIEKLVSSPIAAHWASAYVRELGWYGAQENQPQSATSRKLLIATSLLLNLHPEVGEEVPRNHVAGFNLYAVEHLEKSFADIQTDFEAHLIKYHRVTEKNVALAAHLLLAEAAPEFLVKNLPATLLVGTPPCVEFCRVVAAQEMIAPGSTRAMTYTQLQRLSTLEPVSESQETLGALAAVDPLIDWALLNKIVKLDDVEKSVMDSLKVASNAYARYARTLADNAETLARPLPTRKGIALDILKHVAKGCTFLESNVLQQTRNLPLEDGFNSLRLSPVELHMSNDLATGDWDLKTGESIYKTFPDMLRNLVPPDAVFYRQFNQAYVTHTQAMNTHVKHALISMPLPDRIRLLKGKVTLFTVRPSVARLQTITPISENIIATTLDVILKVTGRKPTESHKEIDDAKGRYAVVICCELEGRMTCYELLTLHGICRENTELAKLIEREKLLNTSVRTETSGYSAPAKVLQLPLDIECYTHGVTPSPVIVSSGVLDKVGELPAFPSLSPINGQYQSFYSAEFDRLVNFVLKHRPLATYEELVRECWGQTRLEALRAKREKDLDTFLNIVVPFKSCIEDLNSDDIDRQRQGVAACTLEAAMTVLLVVGAIAQIASLAAKSMSIATKASKIASIGVGLISNVLNPLDGASDLLLSGTKLLRKGWNKGVAALEGAVYDARKWSGTMPYPALHNVDPDTIRLGTRLSAQNSADVFQVWGIRHSDEWYALNRLGEPWGPKLRNLKLVGKFNFPNPFKRAKPFSYTRKYLEKAIPHARSKIDNTIQLLLDAGNHDVRSVIKHVFGTDSNEAIEYITKNLRAMRKDLNSVGLHNMVFRQPGTDTLAALQPQAYKRWQAAVQSGEKLDINSRTFLSMYSDNLDEYYKIANFDDARIGDIIVHEMSHGAPGTLDLYYGQVLPGSIPAEYNAVGLLELGRNARKAHPKNLANPHHGFSTPKDFEEFESTLARWPKIAQDHPALVNAESYSLAVSLIDQYQTSPVTFKFNLSTITNTINNTTPDKFLPGPLLLNLAKPNL
ncbi:hypothetical protein PSH79_14580 [Pseudomonas sp. FP2196]|uniref:hypothetical protein n=1 Tax=Pseudomonas sp. FP2196 TaxID=2954086 RepID=UPI0027339E80|nr:hypothetical protein [Pseudomonas sp. FP2196]WLH33170.1 hypothetical protein PSH79_14580 [Pseudomonas sp. FP2196]